MVTEPKAGNPWNEQTFFAEAEARSAANVAGLRILLDAALSFEGEIALVWGGGEREPRFMLRRAGTKSGDLLSGWASGNVGIQVGALRGLLGGDNQTLEHLSKALNAPGWLDAQEPAFEAALLERADVRLGVDRLLAAIGGFGRENESRCWAMFANPRIYRIDEAVRERTEDTWVTAGRPIHVGDRVVIWRGRGEDGRRGVVAFGEVLSEPENLDDSDNPYWVESHQPKLEERVRVRYSVPGRLPLWLDEHEDELRELSVARAKGGTVFNVTQEQWVRVVGLASGAPSSPSSNARGKAETKALAPEPSTWLLLTFGDERQYAGNQGYEDDPARVYRYDSFVPNHRQLVPGDAAVLKAPDRTLGCARIERIEQREGTKERQRCPECRTTAIKTRRTARPRYRCDSGHEFDAPITEQVACRKFAAHFGDSFVPIDGEVEASALRAACQNYNGQLAMQRIDRALVAASIPLRLLGEALGKIYPAQPAYLLPDDAAPDDAQRSGTDLSLPYAPSGSDTREPVMRQLRARRGQGAFRQQLRATYGDECMVTGCTLIDLLEAAHISPYRGDDDHHVENGLLLRADVHTLFDLDLLGIEPEALVVRVHPMLQTAGYGDLDGRPLGRGERRPSRAALESRWRAFQIRLAST